MFRYIIREGVLFLNLMCRAAWHLRNLGFKKPGYQRCDVHWSFAHLRRIISEVIRGSILMFFLGLPRNTTGDSAWEYVQTLKSCEMSIVPQSAVNGIVLFCLWTIAGLALTTTLWQSSMAMGFVHPFLSESLSIATVPWSCGGCQKLGYPPKVDPNGKSETKIDYN